MDGADLCCDRCANPISSTEMLGGQAIILPNGAICASCAAALTPEQRVAMLGGAAPESLPAAPQGPGPPASAPSARVPGSTRITARATLCAGSFRPFATRPRRPA